MSLPSIKDHEIIEAMKTRFSSIEAGDDYYYTYTNVTDWFTGTYNNPGDSPSIDIKDDEESLLDIQDSSDELHDINMLVYIDIITIGKLHFDNRKKIEADLLKSINSDLTWGGLAFNTNYLNTQPDVSDQLGRKVSDLRITLGIQFRKDAWSIKLERLITSNGKVFITSNGKVFIVLSEN